MDRRASAWAFWTTSTTMTPHRICRPARPRACDVFGGGAVILSLHPRDLRSTPRRPLESQQRAPTTRHAFGCTSLFVRRGRVGHGPTALDPVASSCSNGTQPAAAAAAAADATDGHGRRPVRSTAADPRRAQARLQPSIQGSNRRRSWRRATVRAAGRGPELVPVAPQTSRSPSPSSQTR
jgi:hypothetical protein